MEKTITRITFLFALLFTSGTVLAQDYFVVRFQQSQPASCQTQVSFINGESKAITCQCVLDGYKPAFMQNRCYCEGGGDISNVNHPDSILQVEPYNCNSQISEIAAFDSETKSRVTAKQFSHQQNDNACLSQATRQYQGCYKQLNLTEAQIASIAPNQSVSVSRSCKQLISCG